MPGSRPAMPEPKRAITIVEEAPATAPFVLRGPLPEMMRDAAAIGYDAVEIHAAEADAVPLAACLDVAAERGITVASLGTGMMSSRDGLTLTHDDRDRRDRALARMQAFVRLAERLGGVVILGLARGLARDCGGREPYLARLRPALSQLVEDAERAGVTIVLEAVNRYEGDLFTSVDETLAFLDGFGSERLKLHADSFHMNIEEADIAASLRRAGRRLGHVHVADSNRLAPGAGHIDFAAIAAALRDIGYAGAVSVECLPLPTPREAAVQALETLRGLR
jgi:sugar phosphate isomerase/epimerase